MMKNILDVFSFFLHERIHMKLCLMLMLVSMCSVTAGFRLPKSVYKSNQVAEASAAALKQRKPLVILMAGEKST